MKWLVIIDPADGLHPETDTSLALINKARSLAIDVDTTTIDKLSFSGRLMALTNDSKGDCRETPLDRYDLIFMRKEPPYDMAFHYAAQLLMLTRTPVVNSPYALVSRNEKLIALHFSEDMAPTLVSSDIPAITSFLEEHETGVIKGLDSFQGISVSKVSSGETEVIRSFTDNGSRPVMVQKFLPEVHQGDKRVLLLGTEVLGCIVRKPIKGYHANFANSQAQLSTLTKREKEVVDRVSPWLLKQGVHFTGLDFIGETLTEINITCPTGIVQLSRLTGRDVPAEMVDYFTRFCSRENSHDT